MRPVVILSGLSVELHDRVRREKSNAFAPNGRLIVKPLPREGFSQAYADSIIQEAYDYAISLPESEPLAITVCCVKSDRVNTSFLRRFFPFALIKLIPEIDTSAVASKHEYNAAVSSYVELLKSEARTLIAVAKVVKVKTNVRNLTPLLLPLRNFQSKSLVAMLQGLFDSLGSASDPAHMLSEAANEFLRLHPKVTPPDSQHSCFTDGTLHFKSPGKARHGYYRPKKNDGHSAECLLNARCRLGGSYAYDFHYDCAPASGGLASNYPNCHGEPALPKEAYVNIAPNDFIRGR